MSKKKVVTFNINEETIEKAKEIASDKDLNLSAVVRRLLEKWIGEQE